MVCFGTLRPLRSLREVCLRAVMSFFARRLRRERRVFLVSLAYNAGAGGVANFVTTDRGRRGSLEEALNVLLYPLRGALLSATLDRGTKLRRGYVSFPF